MFRRRQMKTHSRLMRDELEQGFEHFRMAAAHAAGGTALALVPTVDAAKRSVKPGLRKARGATVATIVPLALAARSGAARAGRQAEVAARAARKSALKGKAKLTGKEPRVKRWPMMLGGLLVAGAAVGAVGAIVARRRANRTQWEEYGASRTTTTGRHDSLAESAKSTVEAGKEKVQSLADSAKDRAADLMGSSSSNATTSEYGKNSSRS